MSRVAICVIAALFGVFILLEPFLIDVKAGLQIFHGVVLIWFWALFMFAGTTDNKPESPGRSRKRG